MLLCERCRYFTFEPGAHSKIKISKRQECQTDDVWISGSNQSFRTVFLGTTNATINIIHFFSRLRIMYYRLSQSTANKSNLRIKEYQPLNIFKVLLLHNSKTSWWMGVPIPSRACVTFITNVVIRQLHQVRSVQCYIDPVSELKMY